MKSKNRVAVFNVRETDGYNFVYATSGPFVYSGDEESDERAVQYILNAGGERTWYPVEVEASLHSYNVHDFYMFPTERNIVIFGTSGSSTWRINANFYPETPEDLNAIIRECYGANPNELLTRLKGFAASYIRIIELVKGVEENLITVTRNWAAGRKHTYDYIRQNNLNVQLWSWWLKDSELPPKTRSCVGMSILGMPVRFYYVEKALVTSENLGN